MNEEKRGRGRPVLPTDEKKIRRDLCIEPAVWNPGEECAAELGMTMPEYVRQAIAEKTARTKQRAAVRALSRG